MATAAEVRTRLHRQIDRLPVLPAVIGKLMTLDRDDDEYFSQVLELIEADPSYSARVLAAANAASSSPRSPVTSVRMSLARLGSTGASNLILAMAVSRVFVPRDDWERSLWRHSLQVANTMRKLVHHGAGRLALDADEGFTAGLLHDIGRFVLLDEVPDELRRIDEGGWEHPEELIELERKICGLTHGEIGQIACERWGLPAKIGQLVRRHHEPGVSLTGGEIDEMIAMAHFADMAMFPSAMPGTPGYDAQSLDVIEAELLPRVPVGFSITGERLQELIVSAAAESDQTCALLGLG